MGLIGKKTEAANVHYPYYKIEYDRKKARA